MMLSFQRRTTRARIEARQNLRPDFLESLCEQRASDDSSDPLLPSAPNTIGPSGHEHHQQRTEQLSDFGRQRLNFEQVAQHVHKLLRRDVRVWEERDEMREGEEGVGRCSGRDGGRRRGDVQIFEEGGRLLAQIELEGVMQVHSVGRSS
jgi:hypothetical protein